MYTCYSYWDGGNSFQWDGGMVYDNGAMISDVNWSRQWHWGCGGTVRASCVDYLKLQQALSVSSHLPYTISSTSTTKWIKVPSQGHRHYSQYTIVSLTTSGHQHPPLCCLNVLTCNLSLSWSAHTTIRSVPTLQVYLAPSSYPCRLLSHRYWDQHMPQSQLRGPGQWAYVHWCSLFCNAEAAG